MVFDITVPQGEAHQFLDRIDEPVVVGRGCHAACLVKLVSSLGDGRLVGDRQTARPAPKNAQLVNGVDALTAATDLHHRQCIALLGARATKRQRDPVDLRLHDANYRAVSFGGTPDHALGQVDKVAQLGHFGGDGPGRVEKWQAGRIEEAWLGPESA